MSDKVPALSDGLRRYIVGNIPSVPWLEALLLLRSGREHNWTSAELAARLYVPEGRARVLLQELERAHWIQPGPAGHRYAPTDPGLDALAEELALVYPRELMSVSRLIHSRTERRAVQFADAFRMKKEE